MSEWKSKIAVVVIFLTSFTAYAYTMFSVILGYIYNQYPGMEKLTILIATLPMFAGVVAAFAAGPLMRFIPKKALLLISLSGGLIGGMIIYFGEFDSVIPVIFGAALTGIGVGLCGPINNSILPGIVSDRIRDKVIGWNDACMSLGMTVVMFLAGVLASDGNWRRSCAIFFAYIPLIVLTILFYPNHRAEPEEDVVRQDAGQKKPAPIGKLPAFVIGLIALQAVSALFNPTFMLNVSDLMINEMALGDSTIVGTTSSAAALFGVISGLIVSFWMKKCKGGAITLAILLEGFFTLISGILHQPVLILASACILSMMMILSQSSKNTYIGLGLSEQQAGFALSIMVGLNSLGEFLCGYFVPWISSIVGVSLPSMNIKVAGIALIILAVISIPVSRASAKNVKIDY